MQILERYASFINGQFLAPGKGRVVKDYNPADSSVVTELEYADDAVLDAAVDAAGKAFKEWGASTREYRAGILNNMADIIEKNADFLASVEAMDVGKPIVEAKMQMNLCASYYRYFAAAILSQDDTMVLHDSGSISAIIREPLGVVGLILPWNAPAMLLTWKAAPALAAGNCIVVKPSSTAPVVILEMARLWAEILPKGVMNVIIGSGSGVGESMLHHPGINKFSFTGSTAAGKHIGAVAGENIIPCTLELGGKSANIIFDDANIERALQYAMLAILSTQGEVCVGGSRLLLQDGIYDEFLNRLKEKFEAVRVGNPMDPAMQMGPVIDEGQMNKILDYIRIGKEEGATLICGGGRITGTGYENGFYIQPTIFAAANTMRIAREEIFGPVLTVIRFKEEKEAIAMANDSEYGLGAAVWTRDLSKAIRVGRAIQAGTVWVNDYLTSTPGNLFGGYKKSGLGREDHKMVLSYYTNAKNLCICPDEAVPSFF